MQYHRHLLGEASEIRSARTLDFHLSSRLDRFQSAQLENNHFRLQFVTRSDKLREIVVEYLLPRKKRAPSIAMEQLERQTQLLDNAPPLVDSKLSDEPTKSLVKLTSTSSMIQSTRTSDTPKAILNPKPQVDSPKKGLNIQKSPIDSPKTPRNLQKAAEPSKTVRIGQKTPGQSPKAHMIKTSISDSPQPVNANQSNNTLHLPKSDPEPTIGDSSGKAVTLQHDRSDEVLPLGKQDVRSFYVTYDRTPGVSHDEDVSKVIFNLQHGEISVYYHYGELQFVFRT